MEFYDKKKDPIKVYFAEKIQMTITKKRTIQIMQGMRPTQSKKNPKVLLIDSNIDPRREIGGVKSLQGTPKWQVSEKSKRQLQDLNDFESIHRIRQGLGEYLDQESPISDGKPKNPEEKWTEENKNRIKRELISFKAKMKDMSISALHESRSKRLHFNMKIEERELAKEEGEKSAKEMAEEFVQGAEKSHRLVKKCLDDQVDAIQSRIQKKSNFDSQIPFRPFLSLPGSQ